MFQMPVRLRDNDNLSHVRGIHRKAGGFCPKEEHLLIVPPHLP